ncbi:hypothetical protein K3F51_05060 [Limosilactobacillus reuteri]|nr:hypothetical protein [Limosilactobacillus reuteri]UAW61284.1 hypothetical protein K3F51_05060 [Limosilactobacillus reuteri]
MGITCPACNGTGIYLDRKCCVCDGLGVDHISNELIMMMYRYGDLKEATA